MPYNFVVTNKYKKDLKKLKNQSRDWKKDYKKLVSAYVFLKRGKIPPTDQFGSHKLDDKKISNLTNIWDIHIGGKRSDWVLIFSIDKNDKIIYLLRTGTHSQLSKEIGIKGKRF